MARRTSPKFNHVMWLLDSGMTYEQVARFMFSGDELYMRLWINAARRGEFVC